MEAMGTETIEGLAKKLFLSKVHPGRFVNEGIPARHLLLAVDRGYNPRWIETGEGPRFLIHSHYKFFRGDVGRDCPVADLQQP